MRYLSKASLLTAGLLIFSSCAKKDNNDSKTTLVPNDKLQEKVDREKSVEKSLQTQLKKIEQSPTITLILMPKKDLQTSIETLVSGGGKLVYDPNNGLGGDIPFYIAELTPDQINDTSFLSSLKLKAASIDAPETAAKPIETKLISSDLDFTNYIPTDSVEIEKLGDKASLGEGITVAVIDTGIDASHPAFGDRVVYWFDGTQETRTKLKKVTVNENSIDVDLNGESKKVILPKAILTEGDVYAGIMSEKSFTTQLDAETKAKVGFLDLNANKASDDFLVVVTKTEEGTKVYFDKTGDLKLASLDEAVAKIDYNATSKANREMGMVDFPSRNNIVKYPILLEEEGSDLYIGLGKTEGMHGTHVAGIIAADDQKNNLLGAAPKADLMSLKVCSGISCTDSAIIKGLYKSFYNGKVVPDVVNISLGSHEKYRRDVYSHVMNDLSAKFGTIFFISASNSGPGFRSLNHFGNSGAVVMVGANVSEKTLRDQYNLPSGASTQNENLLFFSSLGPSYTGEMKPNIIAPGAAISAVPAAGGYMSQANGTSMSSPLAAGAMAAVLGKSRNANPMNFELIDNMREYHLKGSTEAKESLLPYVYAMRDALQNAAEEQAHLTRAQQGYGLIRAGKTKELLDVYMSELTYGTRDYFELVLNDYEKGYDRSTEIKEIKSFKLSIGKDGERTKESLASIIAKGVDVVLDRVEVLSTDGTVSTLKNDTAKKYFFIVDRGNSKNKLLQTHVPFNNRRTSSFHSQRNLVNMEKGKTYIAHYKVNSNDVNISNILDVVHTPYELKKRNVAVSNIDPTISKVNNGFAVENIEIKTNVFHRYPILVTESMNHIKITSAISKESEGRLYVQLYNPKGKEVDFVVAENSPITPYGQAEIKVATAENGKVMTGIWEITISTASSTWMSPSKYDLLVEGLMFGAKKKSFAIKAAEKKNLVVQTAENEIDKILITDLKEVITETVEVKSSYLSFHPLAVSKSFSGNIGVKIIDDKNSFWGALVPSLYIKKGDSFEKYSGEHKITRDSITLTRSSNEQLYFALNTISNYSESNIESKTAKKVTVELLIDTSDKVEINTEVKAVDQIDVSLVEISVQSEKSDKKYRAVMKLISGEIKEVEDINGNTILSISDDALINSIELKIN